MDITVHLHRTLLPVNLLRHPFNHLISLYPFLSFTSTQLGMLTPSSPPHSAVWYPSTHAHHWYTLSSSLLSFFVSFLFSSFLTFPFMTRFLGAATVVHALDDDSFHGWTSNDIQSKLKTPKDDTGRLYILLTFSPTAFEGPESSFERVTLLICITTITQSSINLLLDITARTYEDRVSVAWRVKKINVGVIVVSAQVVGYVGSVSLRSK
jgi:hypothetical protein